MKAQDWVEEYTRTMSGKLVKVKEASRHLSESLRYGLVLKIDPMRYGGAMHARQRPGAFVLWSDGVRVWEPCSYLEAVSER